MQHILDEIDSLAKELKSLLPISSENKLKLDKKYRLEFNYNSNHMEGNTLTYGETELLLIFDDTKGNHSMREYEEMKAHDVAYRLVEEWAKEKERPLTEQNIKNLNEIILVRPFWKEAITPQGQTTKRLISIGNYKEHPNSVLLQNGEIFDYTSPIDTPMQMEELIEWYRSEERAIHPVTLASMLHYKFVRIHPFDDGNGRIARLLMNYVLLRNELPPVIIKSEDKSSYLRALHLADVGDYSSFIEYIATQLAWSLRISLKAARNENINEPEDLDKKLSLLEKELQTVDPNEEIKKQFSKEVFLEIYNSWFTDLMQGVIPVIQKFNRFFTGNRHYLSVQNGNGSVDFVDETTEQVLTRLKASFEGTDRFSTHDCKIVLHTQFGPFIKGGVNSFGCNYGFEIRFDQIKYEVWIDQFSESNRKQVRCMEPRLLHKPLTESEMHQIVTQLGETFYEHIDFHTKKNGLR